GGAKEKSQASDANASRERDWLFEIVRRELPRTVRRRAASSAVLILRSARAEGVSQTRTGVRASRRMRLRYPSCFETHRSATTLGRRRARARCDAPQHGGEDARRILTKRSQWGSCLLDPCETDLRLQETIAGSGPLFRIVIYNEWSNSNV